MNAKDPAFPIPIGPYIPGEGPAHEGHPGMTLRTYAAIHLMVPDSGIEELDEMIRQARARKEKVELMAAGIEAAGCQAFPGVPVQIAEEIAKEALKKLK